MTKPLIKNGILRRTVFAVGLISTALGILGVFLPLLPTTPFILLAAFCFIRSSPSFHAWLLQHQVLGKALQDWEENGAISGRAKVLAILMIVVSLVWISVWLETLWIKLTVSFILACACAFILTRPNASAQ